MLNEVAQAWLLDMQKKMPEFFELPIFDNKGMVTWRQKMKRSDLEWEYIFEWASESMKDANTLAEKSQLPELINALQWFVVDDNWRSLLDKRKFLQYVCWLYGLDEDVVLSSKEVDSNAMDSAVGQAKIEQAVAWIQAETEQMYAPQQSVPEEGSAPQGGDQSNWVDEFLSMLQ